MTDPSRESVTLQTTLTSSGSNTETVVPDRLALQPGSGH